MEEWTTAYARSLQNDSSWAEEFENLHAAEVLQGLQDLGLELISSAFLSTLIPQQPSSIDQVAAGAHDLDDLEVVWEDAAASAIPPPTGLFPP